MMSIDILLNLPLFLILCHLIFQLPLYFLILWKLCVIQIREGVLFKLRKIASPTFEYHQELLHIIQAINTLDYPHLRVVINACYYSVQDLYRIQAELQILKDKNDEKSRLRKAELRRDYDLIETLLSLSNEIINTALSKVSDYTFDEGIALLQSIFPDTSNHFIFNAVLNKFQPLSIEQKFQIMDVASAKGAHHIAANLALDCVRT